MAASVSDVARFERTDFVSPGNAVRGPEAGRNLSEAPDMGHLRFRGTNARHMLRFLIKNSVSIEVCLRETRASRAQNAAPTISARRFASIMPGREQFAISSRRED